MERRLPHITRRVIGTVSIFDLFGRIDGSAETAGIMNYLDGYVRECRLKNVVLNTQCTDAIQPESVDEVIKILKTPQKSVVFFDSPELMKEFMDHMREKKPELCSSLDGLVTLFGKELIEDDKVPAAGERRKTARLKTALNAQLAFAGPDGKPVLADAVVTNLSDTGLFAQYLSLKASFSMDTIDYFKDLMVNVTMTDPAHTANEPLVREGHIMRVEFTGRQAGVAIQFGAR